MRGTRTRMLDEKGVGTNGATRGRPARPVRSFTVNVTESPLGWLLAHGHVTRRQFDAGERLRSDWEKAELAPRVTMAWDAAPVPRGRGGSASGTDLNAAQIDARRRFDAAVEAAGPGLA